MSSPVIFLGLVGLSVAEVTWKSPCQSFESVVVWNSGTLEAPGFVEPVSGLFPDSSNDTTWELTRHENATATVQQYPMTEENTWQFTFGRTLEVPVLNFLSNKTDCYDADILDACREWAPYSKQENGCIAFAKGWPAGTNNCDKCQPTSRNYIACSDSECSALCAELYAPPAPDHLPGRCQDGCRKYQELLEDARGFTDSCNWENVMDYFKAGGYGIKVDVQNECTLTVSDEADANRTYTTGPSPKGGFAIVFNEFLQDEAIVTLSLAQANVIRAHVDQYAVDYVCLVSSTGVGAELDRVSLESETISASSGGRDDCFGAMVELKENAPTKMPTSSPTLVPTTLPTTSPTTAPTSSPTPSPSPSPTQSPSPSPTPGPSPSPTPYPTGVKPMTMPPTSQPTSGSTRWVPTLSVVFAELFLLVVLLSA